MLGRSLIIRLAPYFSADDLRRVLEVVVGNGQIWSASGTPNILEEVFELSKPVLAMARPHWRQFVEDMTTKQQGDATAHDAYPGIRAKLEATS